MEGTAELNRDTDGSIQLAGRECSFSRTFLCMSLTPSGCFSPAVQGQEPEKFDSRQTHDEDRWVGTGALGDGEDGARQGG